jgi:hypothetical protein
VGLLRVLRVLGKTWAVLHRWFLGPRSHPGLYFLATGPQMPGLIEYVGLFSEPSYRYSTFSRPTGRRSNVKDSIRQQETQKASNRQCSHLKDSCSCVLLAN